MQFLLSKNMDPNLSKTVPGIPLRPLNHFLHIFQVWSILVKIVIFAIFDLQKFFHQTLKIDLEVAATFPGRFWKAQGPYFPSLNSDLKFGHFCNPNGNHAFFWPKCAYLTNYTVLGLKRGEKLKFCWCNFYFQKIWTFSFPKPFRSSLCDP